MSAITWTPNIPVTGQSLGITKIPINNNFASAFQAMGVDHFSFGQPNFGRHNKLRFPKVQTQSIGTGTNEIAFYTKTIGGASQLFFQSQGLAPAAADVQMTAPYMAGNTLQNGVGSFTNYSFLPGGFLKIFGLANKNPIGFKITLGYQTTAIYSINITPYSSSLPATSFSIGAYNIVLNDGTAANKTTFQVNYMFNSQPNPSMVYFEVLAAY